ncbi:MAG: acylphosphatase [Bacteroidia bacterium]|jgi:acylphosphatase
MIQRIQITVIGRVQGVFFRAYTEKKAIELGITGYVKNQNDGSVYIDAQGSPVELKNFVAWCHIGAPLSSVKAVQVTDVDVVADYVDFKIKR